MLTVTHRNTDPLRKPDTLHCPTLAECGYSSHCETPPPSGLNVGASGVLKASAANHTTTTYHELRRCCRMLHIQCTDTPLHKYNINKCKCSNLNKKDQNLKREMFEIASIYKLTIETININLKSFF